MYFRRDHWKRTARAPAKLNLYLELLGSRSDGFHDLESLLVPISLSDWLTFTPTRPAAGRSGEILLEVRDCWPVRSAAHTEAIPTDSSNLVVRALQRLRERSGCQFGARVELMKRIPAAAGLGGASSDAAAALRLANRAWQLDWSRDRLSMLAAEIGSDVPFFLVGSAAICRGRGEKVAPLRGMTQLHFVIVKPPVELKTVDVYQAHDQLQNGAQEVATGRADEVAATLAAHRRSPRAIWLHNRLLAAASSLSPWVNRVRGIFDRLDCLGHQLAGSGSAYFGVCRHALHARRLATLLRMQQLGLVYATRSFP